MENNSGGARELVPGSVCRKGLSYRDQQLDRYVSQESHYPLPFLALTPIFYSSCSFAHCLGPGWDDSVVLWDPRAGASYSVLLFLLTHYSKVLFSPLCGRTVKCPSFPGFFCLFSPLFPPKTKSPAFLLLLLPYIIGNSFTLPFFICLSSRMGEPGGAAVPLKQIWRWKSEASEYLHWAEPETEVKITLGLVAQFQKLKLQKRSCLGHMI